MGFLEVDIPLLKGILFGLILVFQTKNSRSASKRKVFLHQADSVSAGINCTCPPTNAVAWKRPRRMTRVLGCSTIGSHSGGSRENYQ